MYLNTFIEFSKMIFRFAKSFFWKSFPHLSVPYIFVTRGRSLPTILVCLAATGSKKGTGRWRLNQKQACKSPDVIRKVFQSKKLVEPMVDLWKLLGGKTVVGFSYLREFRELYSWWFRNPADAPAEVGSLNPIFYRVLYISGGCLGFLDHQQYVHFMF